MWGLCDYEVEEPSGGAIVIGRFVFMCIVVAVLHLAVLYPILGKVQDVYIALALAVVAFVITLVTPTEERLEAEQEDEGD